MSIRGRSERGEKRRQYARHMHDPFTYTVKNVMKFHEFLIYTIKNFMKCTFKLHNLNLIL